MALETPSFAQMSLSTRTMGWADLFAEGRGARLALICLGVWLNAADSLVTSTIMPTVGRDLGGYAYFSWATAAYMVGAILSGATALIAQPIAVAIPAATIARRRPNWPDSLAAVAPERIAPTMYAAVAQLK